MKVHVHVWEPDLPEGEDPIHPELREDEYEDYYQFGFERNGEWIEIRIMKEGN